MNKAVLNALVKLGNSNPNLRPHIKKVVAGMKTASPEAKFEQDVMEELESFGLFTDADFRLNSSTNQLHIKSEDGRTQCVVNPRLQLNSFGGSTGPCFEIVCNRRRMGGVDCDLSENPKAVAKKLYDKLCNLGLC